MSGNQDSHRDDGQMPADQKPQAASREQTAASDQFDPDDAPSKCYSSEFEQALFGSDDFSSDTHEPSGFDFDQAPDVKCEKAELSSDDQENKTPDFSDPTLVDGKGALKDIHDTFGSASRTSLTPANHAVAPESGLSHRSIPDITLSNDGTPPLSQGNYSTSSQNGSSSHKDHIDQWMEFAMTLVNRTNRSKSAPHHDEAASVASGIQGGRTMNNTPHQYTPPTAHYNLSALPTTRVSTNTPRTPTPSQPSYQSPYLSAFQPTAAAANNYMQAGTQLAVKNLSLAMNSSYGQGNAIYSGGSLATTHDSAIEQSLPLSNKNDPCGYLSGFNAMGSPFGAAYLMPAPNTYQPHVKASKTYGNRYEQDATPDTNHAEESTYYTRGGVGSSPARSKKSTGTNGEADASTQGSMQTARGLKSPETSSADNNDVTIALVQQSSAVVASSPAPDDAQVAETPAAPVSNISSRREKTTTEEKKNLARVDVGATTAVLVMDINVAREILNERVKVTVPKGQDDAAECWRDVQIWVDRFARAFHASYLAYNQGLKPTPKGDKRVLTHEECQPEWNRWQKEHDSTVNHKLITKNKPKEFVHARAYTFVHEVVEAHKPEVGLVFVKDTVVAKGMKEARALKCSDRLQQAVDALSNYPIARLDFVEGERLHALAANPKGYAAKKADNLWVNFKKALDNKERKEKLTKEAKPATKGKKRAADDNDANDAVFSRPSKKGKTAHENGDDEVTVDEDAGAEKAYGEEE